MYAEPSRCPEGVPSSVLLDLGGGTGGVSAPLRHGVRQAVVVEPSEALVRGREQHPASLFVCAVGERVPLCDASVDAVLLVEVLHHVSEPALVLAEAARVLRRDGRILIEETEFGGSPLRVIAYWLERMMGRIWQRAPETLCRDLARFGFRASLLDQEGFVILASRTESPSRRGSYPSAASSFRHRVTALGRTAHVLIAVRAQGP